MLNTKSLLKCVHSPVGVLSKSTQKRSVKDPIMNPAAGPKEVTARRIPGERDRQATAASGQGSYHTSYQQTKATGPSSGSGEIALYEVTTTAISSCNLIDHYDDNVSLAPHYPQTNPSQTNLGFRRTIIVQQNFWGEMAPGLGQTSGAEFCLGSTTTVLLIYETRVRTMYVVSTQLCSTCDMTMKGIYSILLCTHLIELM